MRNRLTAHLVLSIVFATSGLLLLVAVKVDDAVDAGVAEELPECVGVWKGYDFLHCWNESCLRGYSTFAAEKGSRCSNHGCGQVLHETWSLPEKQLLPPDTVLMKKQYRQTDGATLQVSVVVSGQEQVSIHRPQICLVGQGFEITGERDIRVESPETGSFVVRMMDLVRRRRTADGRLDEQKSFYLYWFVSRDHETTSHSERMLWTAWRRTLHGESPRWAYIGVSGVTDGSQGVSGNKLLDFVRALRKQIRRKPE